MAGLSRPFLFVSAFSPNDRVITALKGVNRVARRRAFLKVWSSLLRRLAPIAFPSLTVSPAATKGERR
jgi:hypothetical protein